jgi:hypothetical protein
MRGTPTAHKLAVPARVSYRVRSATGHVFSRDAAYRRLTASARLSDLFTLQILFAANYENALFRCDA